MVLHQQARDLADRRHGARGQHGAGNQATQGELALGDQVDPDDDDGQVDELLDKGRGVAGGAGEQPQLGADTGQQGRAFFPFALNGCLGGECLDGLETHQPFDQGGIALRAGAVGGFGQLVHAALHDQRIQHHDGRADHQRNQHEPGNPADHHHEDQCKWQIDERHHRGRTDEVPHRLKGAQVGCERPRRDRSLLHAHAQHPFHDEGRQLDVGPAAGQVDKTAAHGA